jgi:uncharacterized membrane protein YkoI
MRPLSSLALVLALAAPACKSQLPADSFDREDQQREADLRTMQPPRVPILSALAAVQRAIPGGRVLGASVETSGDTPRYWAWIVDGGELHVVRVDAWNGVLLSDVIDDANLAMVRVATEIQSHPEQVALDFAKAIDAARAGSTDAWPAAVFIHRALDTGYECQVELVSREAVRSLEVRAADGKLEETGVHLASAFSNNDPQPKDDLELTEAPAISLASAIELARKRAPDAAFIHAELGIEDDAPNCLVCLWERQSFHILEIDAESGEVLVDGTQAADAESSRRAQHGLRRLDSAIDTARAIEAAIAAVPGSWARMIDLDCEAEPLAYEVEVVAGDVVREVRILARDGTVLGVHDPEESSGD